MVEQPIRNRQVVGSTPTLGSIINNPPKISGLWRELARFPRDLDHCGRSWPHNFPGRNAHAVGEKAFLGKVTLGD